MSIASERKPARPLKLRIHSWMRWLHTYISMLTMIVMLFFALTGISLNHPEWTWGSSQSEKKTQGTLPAKAINGEKVDWLQVVEYLRAHEGVHGAAGDMKVESGEGQLTFKAPGYDAACFFKVPSGTYDVSTTTTGLIGVLNEFHRGKDAGKAWGWLIDVTGVALSLISLTGIGMLFFLKKVRTPGLVLFAVGIILIVVMVKLAM